MNLIQCTNFNVNGRWKQTAFVPHHVNEYLFYRFYSETFNTLQGGLLQLIIARCLRALGFSARFVCAEKAITCWQILRSVKIHYVKLSLFCLNRVWIKKTYISLNIQRSTPKVYNVRKFISTQTKISVLINCTGKNIYR